MGNDFELLMSKFFRHIRQRMLQEKQVTKYLLYAIGEIALVMIGILLALEVDQWNGQRMEDANALRLSTRILAETERNKISVDEEIAQINSAIESTSGILYLMTENRTVLNEREVDNLKFRAFFGPMLNFNSAVLSEALSTGEISKFSNDSLKNLVYTLPTQFDFIREVEVSLDEVSIYLKEFLFDNFSLRRMDHTFSSTGKILGESDLAEFDNRKMMSSQRLEIIMDEKCYTMSRLVEKYEAFDLNLEELSKILQTQIDSQKK